MIGATKSSTHKRITKFKLLSIFLFGVICCWPLWLIGCSSPSSDNIFNYAVDINDSIFSSARAGFGMSMEEVLEATQLSEDNVDYRLGENEPMIIHQFELPGLSDDIMEIFSFSEDMLVSVDYIISIPQTDLEKTCQTLQEQASSVIPKELFRGVGSVEESILAHKNTVWEDTKQNTVSLVFPTNVYEDVLVISLMLDASKETILNE